MEHEWGRQISAAGDHGRSGFERGGQAPLLGKTRARLFIQPGHGRRNRTQGFIGGADDSVGLGDRQIIYDDLNHRPASSRPRRYIS